MMLFMLLLPAIVMFAVSFIKNKQAKWLLPISSIFILLPIIQLFLLDKPYLFANDYLLADKLNTFILLVSSIVGIGVTLALLTLSRRVSISKRAYRRFYRSFAIFWVGLILSILSNHMGVYWIGLELATLATVYMIKTNNTPAARKEAWNYMIVGAISVSLILFGIILMYASAKPALAEQAMRFDLLIFEAERIPSPFLFEIGFSIATIGMFVKMGFFPMSLWLPNIERASFYPVAALFSGILESAVIIGFFRLSKIMMLVNYTHLFWFVFIYALLTIFIVSLLIFKAKDFMRLFSLSGIEHMALIVIFWVSGGTFAALLHLGAHAFLKPALFLSTGVLESGGRYQFAGTLKGYTGAKAKLFALMVSLLLLGVISVPPSPMFFSELSGFASMLETAQQSHYMLAMIGAIVLLLIFLSIIFYRFINIFQSMKYEVEAQVKTVYVNELLVLIIFAASLLLLLTPLSLDYLRSIQ